MKLPWDKNYLKISFHVIITILAIYIMSLIIKNINGAMEVVTSFFNTLLIVIRPLTIALIFSYLVNPAVNLFQKLGDKYIHLRRTRNRDNDNRFLKRTKGTAITYIIILIVLIIVGNVLAKKIGSADITTLASSINDYIQEFSDMLVLLEVKLAELDILKMIDQYIDLNSINTTITTFAKNSVMNIATTLSSAGGWVINVVIGLTAAFYLLMEKDKILYYSRDAIDVFLPAKASNTIKGVCHDINSIFSGYIGGQITDAAIMTVLISLSFWVAGIRYPLMIGIISGFSNLIPYVGAFVAFVLSVSVGLLSGTPIKALYAVIIVVVLQQIDGLFIVPRVVGKSVELHPVLVLLSLSIFGSLFGLLGMIVAVPCTALIKLFLTRFYLKKKVQRENL